MQRNEVEVFRPGGSSLFTYSSYSGLGSGRGFGGSRSGSGSGSGSGSMPRMGWREREAFGEAGLDPGDAESVAAYVPIAPVSANLGHQTGSAVSP